MGSAIDIAKVSAKGSVALTLGMVVSNLVMALGTLLMASLLPTEDYGLYAVVLIPNAFFNIFQGLGINSAIIKYTAQYRSEGRHSEIKKILACGILFTIALGIVLSLICFASAGFIATSLFHRPQIKGLIEIASIVILLSAVVNFSQSVFVGFERMEFYSLTMTAQSVLRGVLSPLLVFLGYGVFGAVVGVIVSSMAAAVFGLALVILHFYRKIEVQTDSLTQYFGEKISLMLRYGLPVSASMILQGFRTQFYNFLMAAYCSDEAIANYQMALNFTVLISFFVFPIATVLFPAFSKLSFERDEATLRTVFRFSVKYSMLVVLPVAVVVMALSKPMVYALFGGKFEDAPLYLSLLAVNNLYIGMGSLSVPNIIKGQGRTDITLKLTLLSLSVGIPLSLVLVPSFGIIGLIIATLLSGFPGLAVGLWWVRRNFKVSIDGEAGMKIYAASGLSGLLAYLTARSLALSYWLVLIFGGVVFLVTYVVSVVLLRAIDSGDLKNLKEALSSLGPLYRLVEAPLNFMERLLPS
ncbi:hypothetical protein B6U84_02985 [Candidatus Bathyarchaeota archaeon ex4484_40]|nr:MAG: hypothetical protein B6U84_02985 [Candidatus Bathyarchaeota archaeon ex4484_40]